MKFSSLAALKVVILTTFSAASDEDFVKTTTFSFQWFTCTISNFLQCFNCGHCNITLKITLYATLFENMITYSLTFNTLGTKIMCEVVKVFKICCTSAIIWPFCLEWKIIMSKKPSLIITLDFEYSSDNHLRLIVSYCHQLINMKMIQIQKVADTLLLRGFTLVLIHSKKVKWASI